MNTNLHHGTSFEFDSFETGTGLNTDEYDGNVESGVFLTTNRADADFYAGRSEARNGGAARVIECRLADGARVLVFDDELAEQYEDTDPALVELAEDGGYDAIDFGLGGSMNTPGTILVLNLASLEMVNG
ncbi:MAG: hypothetical protein AAGN46_04565 [Acidobacteriota bacterium]